MFFFCRIGNIILSESINCSEIVYHYYSNYYLVLFWQRGFSFTNWEIFLVAELSNYIHDSENIILRWIIPVYKYTNIITAIGHSNQHSMAFTDFLDGGGSINFNIEIIVIK